MIFDILLYILIAFALLSIVVCHIQWFKMRKIMKKEHASLSVIDNFFPFRFLGKFRSFVGSCTDDNKRARYIQLYQQAHRWKNISLVTIVVSALSLLLTAF